MATLLRSTAGVETLISQACAEHERTLLGRVFSPLFPDDAPWNSLSEIPEAIAKMEAPRLTVITQALVDYRAGLTQTAGKLAPYLDASEEDIRELALRYAKYQLPGQQKLAWASRLLGSRVPGKSLACQLARINDARFWRRAIRTRLFREREHFFLRLRLVGKSAEFYVSDVQSFTRHAQLRRQETWMLETVLIPRYLVPGLDPKTPLTLKMVASTSQRRFAKLYAFTKAMDEIAVDAGLSAGMLTLTLEPEWHPNPSHGTNSWNGASPRDAHRSMAKRWQSILRDLDRAGIGLSGLRVVEPHKDGCPHWHIWLLYHPKEENTILTTVMRYFPNKLKIRALSCKGVKNHSGDRIFESPQDLSDENGRPLKYPKEGAQVELSRIDRRFSNGASYAMKYLLKTVDAGNKLNKEVGLFPETEDAAEKKARHKATAKRVDAYRSLWGINAGQLFGVAKCLIAWDELRGLPTAPANPELKRLWMLARGSDKEGRIGVSSGQRGDAKGFIQALGGLAAAGKPAKDAIRYSIGRLTEEGINSYGEPIERTKGVTLVKRQRIKVEKLGRPSKKNGACRTRKVWRSVKTVVAAVVTKLREWLLVPKKHQASAIAQAESRYVAGFESASPSDRQVLAVRGFWNRFWEAVESLPAPLPEPVFRWLN